MSNPNLNVYNNTMSSQQNQQSQRTTVSRNTNYANVTSKDSFPKREQAIIIESLENVNIEVYLDALSTIVQPTAIRFISRIAQNRICVYLESIRLADELVERKCKLTINNQQLPIRSLIVKNKRIVLSNVCPSIPHYIVEQELRKMGIEPMSPITYLRTGTSNTKYTHILSFRRQVYVSPADEKKLPDRFQINYEDINYWIYPTCDSLKCFLCKDLGHLARNCPINSQGNQQSPENTETTLTDTFSNLLPQQQLEPETSTVIETLNDTQVLASSQEEASQVTKMTINKQDILNTPVVNVPEFTKRPHPPTESTISSLDLIEEPGMETDSEYDSEAPSSEASVSTSNNPSNSQVTVKNTAKKRKVAEREDFYDAAWKNVKEKVESQDPPVNYVLNTDQLRHLIENTKGKNEIRDTVKLYSEDIEGIILMCEAVRPFMTKSLKNQRTRFVNKLKALLE